MGLAGHSINLSEIIEDGSFLLVNLAPSDYLSHENAAVFGALLVNEFFECAMRRDTKHGDPKPYYLYLDEFQNFISPAIAGMLDQIRKFGIFLTLAHQRFGQLDEDIIDAVLTNCKIKAVFGGLRAESAEHDGRGAVHRQIGSHESQGRHLPDEILAQLQPRQGLHPRHSHGTTRSTSSTTGGSETTSASLSAGSSQAYFYDDWFSMPQLSGTRTETTSTGSASMSGKLVRAGQKVRATATAPANPNPWPTCRYLSPCPFRSCPSVQYFRLRSNSTR